MIESNRVSRLIHKATFLPRQRAALDHSHKYVISNRDVAKEANRSLNSARKPSLKVEKIVEGFDPENCEQDRRILYEVLGMRIYRDEFRD